MIKELWQVMRMDKHYPDVDVPVWHFVLRLGLAFCTTMLMSLVFLLGYFFILVGYRDWVNGNLKHKKNPILRFIFYCLATPFVVLDVIGNYTLFTVLFESASFGYRPPDMKWWQNRTITHRLSYHKANPGGRGHLLALWICTYLVERIDPGHCGGKVSA